MPLRGPACEFGALWISAGARLVAGEPSHAHLGVAPRLEREIGDAFAALAKIGLTLRHWAGYGRRICPRHSFEGAGRKRATKVMFSASKLG